MTGMRIRTESLGGSPLVAAALASSTPAGWYHPVPRSTSAWRERVDSVRKEAATARWFTALEPAFNARGPALERLRRSALGAGIVVTTGQQPGLFGGPLYALSKALSALAFADELQRVTGVPVAPVFWAATDDADIAEASTTSIAGTGGAQPLRLETVAPPGTPLANIPLGDVVAALSVLADAAGSGSHYGYLEAVRAAYVPTATVGDAYVQLMRALLEDRGIAVLDASHPAVRDAADGLLRQALRSGPAIDAALQKRHAAIVSAGWTPQVALVRGLSLVFTTEQGIKRRLPLKEAERAATEVERGALSPNVLLRPIAERAMLPTVAYIAGPGELAYFAQLSTVAETVSAEPPLVLPRWSGTVIEPHIGRLLDRYHLEIDDLRDPHAAETRFARAALPGDVMDSLQSLRGDVAARVQALGSSRPEGSALLPPAVLEGAARTLQHRVDRLERRFLAAQKRQSHTALADIATARGALYPNGRRQERALNAIPLLVRHGPAVLDSMLDAARVHARAVLTGDAASARTREDPTVGDRAAG